MNETFDNHQSVINMSKTSAKKRDIIVKHILSSSRDLTNLVQELIKEIQKPKTKYR